MYTTENLIVRFIELNTTQYDNLDAKDEGALYFIKDSHKIYRGNELYSSGTDAVYVVSFDSENVMVNDYSELETAVKSGNCIMIKNSNGQFINSAASYAYQDNIKLYGVYINLLIVFQIDKITKQLTLAKAEFPFIDIQSLNTSGYLFYNKENKTYSLADIQLPKASDSEYGVIKIGDGLSISADGKLSVVTPKYYTGTSDPQSALGNNGDIYLKTEK